MRMVNGYVCRNCADEELAKKNIDPAHPKQSLAGSEAFVSPAEAAKNSGVSRVTGAKKGAGSNADGSKSDALTGYQASQAPELGVNRPESSGEQGRVLNLYA